MKKLFMFLLVALMGCSCAHVGTSPAEDEHIRTLKLVRAEMRQAVFLGITFHWQGRLIYQGTDGVPVEQNVDKDASAAASGVIVGLKGEKTLIMTSAHNLSVNEFDEYESGIIRRSNFRFFVQDYFGDACAAHELAVDKNNDVALIVADCKLGTDVAQLATSLPPIGEQTVEVGCPMMYHGFQSFYVSDGRFLGIQPEFENPKESGASKGTHVVSVFSGATAPGSSGSGVYDYEGKLFGISEAINGKFPVLAFASSLDSMRALLASVGDKW